ncbi:hypothetical protein TrST_g13875 [Triparma strigata]|uniref:RING-type E3 ubiquitin transferase n=1 Tax=Triparma strigata TaxID=1606541 RepID=A0A9W7EI90_9STRA|nr:hypothetical protein TrST_g13875 [Triparma strigata]
MTLLLMDNPNDLDHARKRSKNSKNKNSSDDPDADVNNPYPGPSAPRHAYNDLVTSSILPYFETTNVYESNVELKEDNKMHSNHTLKQDTNEPEKLYLSYPLNASGYYRGHWSLSTPPSTSNPTPHPKFGPLTTILPSSGVSLPDPSPLYSLLESPLPGPSSQLPPLINHDELSLPLTASSGRLAFQLYSKPLPHVPSLRLLRGLIKIYDGNAGGSNRDVLLYVVGVHVVDIGRISLVGNWKEEDVPVVEVWGEGWEEKVRRLVEEEVGDVGGKVYGTQFYEEGILEEFRRNEGWMKLLESGGFGKEDNPPYTDFSQDIIPRILKETPTPSTPPDASKVPPPPSPASPLSSLRLANLPFSSKAIVSPLERSHLKNVRGCDFSVTLQSDVGEYPRGEMAKIKLVREQLKAGAGGDPRKDLEKEPYIMQLEGDIISHSCSLSYNVSTTAIRIDWESATDKAVNYSVWQTLACLVQIVLLLRQLHHTQSASAASRVSILCIGAQGIIDSLSTIFHISLCVFIQSLFTAFLSIVFFKLLIFAIIELKYMSIINSARQPNLTPENSRRQVTLLHARFYAAFFATLMFFYVFRETSTSLCVLLLYSFWVPQIILNVTTEARKPLHIHYIIGMSITRCMLPLYLFGYGGNFVAVAFQGFKIDFSICFSLVVWVGFQASVLILQMKWGTRFFIPAKFLPTPFDYSRPIPQTLMRQVTARNNDEGSSEGGDIEMGVNSSGTYSRHPKGGSQDEEETTQLIGSDDEQGGLDCVICCSAINVNDPSNYMIPPCEHIFHRSCLTTWMDVKMECPTCRGPLPAI